jgi:RNA polymerase primary sigma factor
MRQLKIATQITNRDSQAVEKYLQDISRLPMINAEEETVLAQKIRGGDTIVAKAALEKMVKSNLRFVVSVAKQYQHQGLTLSDLINEGNLGLIKAAQDLMKPKGLNLFLTLCGGFVSPFCRLWQNKDGLSDFHRTKLALITKLIRP